MTAGVPCDLIEAREMDFELLGVMFSDYLRDLAAFDENIDATAKLQNDWVTRPGRLFPYRIDAQGETAGFALIMGREFSEAIGVQVDYFLHDFYVAPERRAQGVAESAALQVFDRLRGRWGLDAIIENRRAVAFWDRVLAKLGTEIVRGLKDEIYVTYRFELAS